MELRNPGQKNVAFRTKGIHQGFIAAGPDASLSPSVPSLLRTWGTTVAGQLGDPGGPRKQGAGSAPQPSDFAPVSVRNKFSQV